MVVWQKTSLQNSVKAVCMYNTRYVSNPSIPFNSAGKYISTSIIMNRSIHVTNNRSEHACNFNKKKLSHAVYTLITLVVSGIV